MMIQNFGKKIIKSSSNKFLRLTMKYLQDEMFILEKRKKFGIRQKVILVLTRTSLEKISLEMFVLRVLLIKKVLKPINLPMNTITSLPIVWAGPQLLIIYVYLMLV